VKEGTKSVLFGAHSIMHSLVVIISWKKLYHEWPSWKVVVCIFLHDIGYWGKNYISEKSNEGHAELGCRVAHRLFGPEYGHLVLGHSSSACKKFGIPKSLLEAPDDYSWIIAPLWWMHWNAWIENFSVGPEQWKKAVKDNFYKNHKLSGTELFHSLKKEDK